MSYQTGKSCIMQWKCMTIALYISAAYASSQTTLRLEGIDENVIVSEPLIPEQITFSSNITSFTIGGLFAQTDFKTNRFVYEGIQQVEAMKFAVDKFNNIRDTLPNITLKWAIENTRSSVPDSFGTALYLRERNIIAVVGPSFSDTAASVDNIFSIKKAPVMSPSATSVFLSGNFSLPTFLRTIPDDSLMARAIAGTCQLFGWTLVAALYSADTIGLSGQVALANALSRARIRSTCVNTIPPGSVTGAEAFGRCLSDSFATVIILWMSEESARTVVSTLSKNPFFSNRLTFISPYGWSTITETSGFVGNFPSTFLTGSLAFLPNPGDTSEFRSWWVRRNPQNSNYPAFLQFWQERFQCKLFREDLPTCPLDIGARIIECKCTGTEVLSEDDPISTNVNYVHDAVLGYSTALDRMTNRCFNLAPNVKNLCKLPQYTTEQYFKVLSSLRYTGLTGPIAFTPGSSNRQSGSYWIYQLRPNGSPEFVGVWNTTGAFLIADELLWKNGTSVPISEIIPDTTTFENKIIAKVVVVISVIFILLAVAFMIAFLVKRKSRVVVKARLLFLQSVLFGLILWFGSLCLWSIDQSVLICNLKVFMAVLGYSIIIGNVAAKTMHVFMVFTNIAESQTRIRNWMLLAYTGAVCFINMILLAVLLLISPGYKGLKDQVTQSEVATLYQYITCDIADEEDFKIVMIAAGIVNALILIFIYALNIISRKVRTPYSESKYLSVVILDFIVVGAITIAVYFTLVDSEGIDERRYTTRSIGMLIVGCFTLLVLFVPKILALRKIIMAETTSDSNQDSSSRVTEVTSDGSGGYSGASSSYTEQFSSRKSKGSMTDSKGSLTNSKRSVK